MKFSRDLSDFLMTLAAVAAVFFFCFYTVLMTHPELSSKLISCGISVAVFLFGVIFVAIRSFSYNSEEAFIKDNDPDSKLR